MQCCDLFAGQLRTPVTIENRVRTPDGVGGWIISFAPFLKARCRYEERAGNEFMAADRLIASKRVTIWMRYRSGINETQRAVISGRAMNIRSVVNMEGRNRWLAIELDAGVAP